MSCVSKTRPSAAAHSRTCGSGVCILPASCARSRSSPASRVLSARMMSPLKSSSVARRRVFRPLHSGQQTRSRIGPRELGLDLRDVLLGLALSLAEIGIYLGLMAQVVSDDEVDIVQPQRVVAQDDFLWRRSGVELVDDPVDGNARAADAEHAVLVDLE